MNAATLWARTAVAALADAGLRDVCIAPGSRSTALALAFAAHPDVRITRHLDERSAGFFALGMAQALGRPVALLCTSGTATVNFMPAAVEARMAHVPLLLLTADRPPELRHSGANQTIDQIDLYGKQVLWSVDLPLPEAAPPAVALRNLAATMARALAVAAGLPNGPVHLNFPFRKPFEPDGDEAAPAEENAVTAPRIVPGRMAPAAETIEQLVDLIREHERGLIVCGPGCPGGAFAQTVAALAQRSGYPLLADPLSGVRYGPWVEGATVVGGYEGILAQGRDPWGAPQLVLRFGAAPTSKWLNQYLQESAPSHRVHIRENGVWADDSHQTTLFIQANEILMCEEVLQRLPARAGSAWQQTVAATEARYWQTISAHVDGPFFDGLILYDVVKSLPADALLFVGNSLPVRHLDEYGAPRAVALQLFGNRGASGIDGNISTAAGIAAARQQPVTMVVGDVTFYHDMNGLLAGRAHDLDLTIVLMNNDGGSIFRRLPVARFDPPFTELFLTPHGLDFAHAARLYGFEHVRVEAREAFRDRFAQVTAQGGRHIIEVCSDGAEDAARRAALQKAVQAGLSDGQGK